MAGKGSNVTVEENVILQWMEQASQLYVANDFKSLSTGINFTGVLDRFYTALKYSVHRKHSTLETLSERFAYIREHLTLAYGDYVESIINISACKLGDTDALMNVSLLLLCSLINAIIYRPKHCVHFLPGLYKLRPAVQRKIKACIQEWMKSDNDKMGLALANMKNILRTEDEVVGPSPRDKKRKTKLLSLLQVYFESEEIKQEIALKENRHLQLINEEKSAGLTREIAAAAVGAPSTSGSQHMFNFCSNEDTGTGFIMQAFKRSNRQSQMPELPPFKTEMSSLMGESSPFGAKRKRSFSFQGPEEVESSEKDARIKELENMLKHNEQLLKQKEQIIVKLNVEKQNLQSRGNLFQLKYDEISKSQEAKTARELTLAKELQETKLELDKYKVSPKKLPGNKFHTAEIKKLKLAHTNELLNATKQLESKIKAVESEKECLRKELEKVTEIYGSSLKSVEDFNEQERRLTLQSQVYEEKIMQLTNKLQVYEEKFGNSTSQPELPLGSSGHEERQVMKDPPQTDNNFQLKTEECDPELQASRETVAKLQEQVERVNTEYNLRIAKYEEEKSYSDILISQCQEKIASCHAEYQDKLRESEEQILKYEEERKSGDVLIAEQKIKIIDFEEQITEMKNKCKDLDNKVLDYEKRIQISDTKVEECISAAELEKKKHDEMIKNLKTELAQAKVNIQDFEDKVADYEEKIKISNEKATECSFATELEKQKHDKEIKNFEALLAETKNNAKHFEQLVTEDEVKMKILNAKVEDYQRVISQMDSQIAQYKKRVTECELQHAKDSEKLLKLPQLEEKIEELDNQNKKLFQQVKDHQASDARAAVSLKELKNVHKAEISGLDNRINQLEMEINNKNASLLQDGKKYKECKNELEYTGKLLTEVKKEKNQCEQELLAIKQARIKENDERSLQLSLFVENSDKMKRSLQEKIENLTNENEVFRKQMEIKNAQMEEKEALQLEKERALTEIEELHCAHKKDIKKLNVEIESLQNEISNTKFRLEEALRIHTCEKSKMEKEKDDLLIDMKKIREDSSMEIKMLQEKHSDSLEEQLRIHTCEKTKLEKENEDLLKKIDDFNTEIEKLQGELSEKTRLYEELRNTASPEKIAELKKKINVLAKQHNKMRQIALDRGAKIKKCCEETNQSKKELVDYKRRIAVTFNADVASEVYEKTNTLQTEVATLQEKLRSRDKEVNRLNANITRVREAFTCEIAKLKSEYEEQVRVLKIDKSELTGEVKELKCSIDEEKQEFIMSLQQKISDLMDLLYSKDELSIDTRRKHEAERLKDCALNEKLHQQIAEVKDELKFYEEHNDLTGLKKLQGKIDEQEVEKDKLKKQIYNLEKINKSLRLYNGHYQNQIGVARALRDKYKNELAIAKEKCAALSTTEPGSAEQKKETNQPTATEHGSAEQKKKTNQLTATERGSAEQKKKTNQPKNLKKIVAGPSGTTPNSSRVKLCKPYQKTCPMRCRCKKTYPWGMKIRPQPNKKTEIEKQKELEHKMELEKQRKALEPYNIDFKFLAKLAMQIKATPEMKKHFYFPPRPRY